MKPVKSFINNETDVLTFLHQSQVPKEAIFSTNTTWLCHEFDYATFIMFITIDICTISAVITSIFVSSYN